MHLTIPHKLIDENGNPCGHPEPSWTATGPAKIAELEKQRDTAEKKLREFLASETELRDQFASLTEAADHACKRLTRAEAEAEGTRALLAARLAGFRANFGSGSDASGTAARVADIALAERSLALIDGQLETIKAEASGAWTAVETFAAKHRIAPEFMPTRST